MRSRSLLHRLDIHGQRRRETNRPRRSRLALVSLEERSLPSFVTAPAYPADVQPYSVGTGDFDGDGDMDLATANYYPGTVSVFLGNGDGTFQNRTDYAASGFNLHSLVVADFNRDGALDLAAIYDQAYVLLGNGDGTFQTARTFPTGGVPMGMSVGDFNGDNCPDLAVSNGGGISVGVLLGNGDGTFGDPSSFAAGISHSAVAVGDFNGDSKQDLVTTNGDPDEYSVNVLLGNGDGTFGAVRSFPVGNEPWSVAAGDFNGDGFRDLVVANRLGNNVSVLLSLGDGTFQTRVNYAVGGTFPVFVAVGDWDGDGDDDLATANGSNTVSILQGQGNGTFQAGGTFAVGAVPSSLAAGDFDRDGDLDLAAANTNTLSNTVSVLLGDGDGTFDAPRSYAAGNHPSAVTVGDFNEDGVPDLAVANYHGANGNDDLGLSVLLGRGDDTFQTAVNNDVGIYATSVAVGDFNGDGHQDLVVNRDGFAVTLLGNGDGTFQAARFYAGGGRDLTIGDFDNDGRLDLVTSGAVLLGNGDGTFQAARYFWAGNYPFSVTAGDFNRDGRLDLAVGNYDAPYKVSVVLGNGDGSFQAPLHYGDPTLRTDVAVGDFNGDGALDVAVANETYPNGTVSVFLGNGNGTFGAARDFLLGLGWSWSVAVEDFNGDGNLDLALTTAAGYPSAADTVSVMPGLGDGNFLAPIGYNAGVTTRSVAVGDFNGDHWPDLGVANWDANTATVLLNEGGSVAIDQAAGQPDPTAGATVTFDVTFSQPVTGFDASDIDLSASTVGGTLVPVVTGSGSSYTVTVTGMAGAGTVVASIAAGAAVFGAGIPTPASTSTDNTVAFDLPPTVIINQAAGQPDPTNAPSVAFDVKFNEPVTGFEAADVSLTGSTAGGTLLVAVTGSLDTYTVIVTGMTTRGLVVASVPAGAAIDSLGSPNVASTSTDNVVEFRQTGTIGFTQAVYQANEDSPTATVTVSRTGPTDGDVSVRYSTSPGTAREGTDYTAATGTVTWADGVGGDKTFTIPILNDGLNEGRELLHVALTDPVGSPGLGPTEATVQIAPSDGQGPGVYFDQDGDRYRIALNGRTGSLLYYRTDPDGDGWGPIELIELSDTLPDPVRPKAALTIGVAKAKTSLDGGTVGLGSITGPGLKSISARRTNLNGEGIHLNGYVGSLVLGNISNGADVVTGTAASPTQKTRLSALSIGDGTAIDVGAPLISLTASSMGAGSVRAPSIGTLTVRGNMAADMTVTGAGVEPGRKALTVLRVTGTVAGSDISVAGDVGSVVVGAFRDSRLFAGYAGPDIPDPASFYQPATVGTFRTTARFDAFQNSRVIATNFKTVVISSVGPGNLPARFGFYADGSLGSVTVRTPVWFRYDPALPTPQGVGEFEVMVV